MVKYKLTLVEKKIVQDTVVVEIDPNKGFHFQLVNEMRKLKIANHALGRPRTKVIKELIN